MEFLEFLEFVVTVVRFGTRHVEVEVCTQTQKPTMCNFMLNPKGAKIEVRFQCRQQSHRSRKHEGNIFESFPYAKTFQAKQNCRSSRKNQRSKLYETCSPFVIEFLIPSLAYRPFDEISKDFSLTMRWRLRVRIEVRWISARACRANGMSIEQSRYTQTNDTCG